MVGDHLPGDGEIAVEQLDDLGCAERFGHRGEVADVAEEDGDVFLHPAELQAGAGLDLARGGVRDHTPQLLLLGQADHHLVEAGGQQADLVPTGHRDLQLEVALGHLADALSQSMERPRQRTREGDVEQHRQDDRDQADQQHALLDLRHLPGQDLVQRADQRQRAGHLALGRRLRLVQTLVDRDDQRDVSIARQRQRQQRLLARAMLDQLEVILPCSQRLVQRLPIGAGHRALEDLAAAREDRHLGLATGNLLHVPGQRIERLGDQHGAQQQYAAAGVVPVEDGRRRGQVERALELHHLLLALLRAQGLLDGGQLGQRGFLAQRLGKHQQALAIIDHEVLDLQVAGDGLDHGVDVAHLLLARGAFARHLADRHHHPLDTILPGRQAALALDLIQAEGLQLEEDLLVLLQLTAQDLAQGRFDAAVDLPESADDQGQDDCDEEQGDLATQTEDHGRWTLGSSLTLKVRSIRCCWSALKVRLCAMGGKRSCQARSSYFPGFRSVST